LHLLLRTCAVVCLNDIARLVEKCLSQPIVALTASLAEQPLYTAQGSVQCPPRHQINTQIALFEYIAPFYDPQNMPR
jgi:hypothetical protein